MNRRHYVSGRVTLTSGRRRSFALLALAAALTFVTFVATNTKTEGAGTPGATLSQSGTVKDQTLSSELVTLADAADASAIAGRSITSDNAAAELPPSLHGLVNTNHLQINDAGEVQVFITGDPNVEDLAGLGTRVDRVSEDGTITQAWLPASALRNLGELDGVETVRLPDYAYVNVGSVTTQGDAVLKTDQLRDSLGIDGSGITVGVISDGAAGLAASVASGDLPNDVDTTTCNMVPGSATHPDAGSEGTAMLEIVHDIASGADLMFGHFGFSSGGTVLDFNAAVDCLASHADIVVDDIGFFNAGAYDGTSIVSENTAGALNGPGPIRGYFNAVGNQAQSHYHGTFSDSGFTESDGFSVWNLHHFTANGSTTDGGIALDCECADAMVLNPGGTVVAFLQWDDPFGNSTNDYDFFLYADETLVSVGGDPQSGSPHSPREMVGYTNLTGGQQYVDLAIGNWDGLADPVEFDMFVLCAGACETLPNGADHNFNTVSSSVPNNSDAGGSPVSVISVGAVWQGAPNQIEPFSSNGPTNDNRMKPDVSAPDGVSVTGNGGFGSPFYGTSAAAPHAAAVAALLLECDPGTSRSELYDKIVDHAIDLGGPGADMVFGAGRLNAVAAGSKCAVEADTPTPVPTATPVPTSTPKPTDTPVPGETPEVTPTTKPEATATKPPPPTYTATASATPVSPTNTPTRTPTNTPVPILFGDANCNGVANALDAALILQYAAGIFNLLPCDVAADANHDGSINAIDSTLVLQLAAGLLNSLGP